MPTTETYGAFGTREVERDDDGFIERLAIVQASGLFGGAPPAEMRIRELIPRNDEKWGRRRTAKLNRRTDLPFYLTRVKVKVVGEMEKITDDDLAALGLERLPDEE